MSSLGDLLLGNAEDKSSSAEPSQTVEKKYEPPQSKEEGRTSNIYLKRVVKDEQEDDIRSNASSTDDYVRELLDPNDRPRNVWHVVEGPKGPSNDGDGGSSQRGSDGKKHGESNRSSRSPRDKEKSFEPSHRDRKRRRSHSRSRNRRSRSRSLTRRRDRSRSKSKSPIMKRNSRTVLVMQLNPRVTSRDLEDYFSDVGAVREVRLIMDSKTRRHKGIAYIEFEKASSASKALSLDGGRFMGAPLMIQSASTDRNKSDWHSTSSHYSSSNHQTSSHHSSSRSHLPPNAYRVYAGSLHLDITEEMLRSIFEPFGPLLRVELIKDRSTGISRGYAFITFASIEDGQEAVRNLDGFELAGKNLRVSKSADKNEH